MEENIQKILNEKDENVVQFNLVNTTSQNQFVDLFNTDTLTGISFNSLPTNLANTSLGSFTYPFSGGNFAFNTSNGDIFIGNPFSNIVYVYDSNLNPITSIILGFPFINTTRELVYNPSNNTMYVIPLSINQVKIIDCSNYTIINTLITPISNYVDGAFCTFNNSLYITTNIGFVIIIDSTLTISTLSVSPQPYFIVYDTIQNRMYFGDNVTNVMDYIDCSTNTYVPISIPFPPIGFMPLSGVSFCPLNNKIYIPDFFTIGQIIIFETNSNSFQPSISFSVLSQCGTIVFDSNQQLMYVSYASNDVVYFNPLTNLELGVFNTLSPNIFLLFNPYNNQLGLISNATSIFEVFTTANLYSVPYFITGSSNYNAFVNNLNNEPIFIQMIRLFTQNQNQLTNELQLTTIDSNGNQIFMPNFPINEVSAYQQQGNIGEITLKDIVFDGRTYINQYQLNPYESLSFEIYYKQLDLTTASVTLPMFFKNKIPLKEYINKQLNL